ncbi:MAG: FHA domain-containing protein [Barnesiella sp.]|nr:FHA domain-containing protein [Barnesiella sp.]
MAAGVSSKGNAREFPVSHCPNCRVGLKFDRTRNGRVRCPKCNYSGPVATFSVEGSCPNCNRKVLIRNEFAYSVICPHCKVSSTVDAYLGRSAETPPSPPSPQSPPPPRAAAVPPIPGNPPASDLRDTVRDFGYPKTEISTGNIENMRPGILLIDEDPECKWYGDRHIRLSLGRNTFGRSSASSKADVQLPTRDMTISKIHFVIEMRSLPSGEIQHLLSDAGSTNGTSCNGQTVAPGDMIILEPGNKIRVGRTVLKFQII